MTTLCGTSKIKLGLVVIVICSLIVAALIYAGMNARGGSYYYARAAQLPFYAGLYGIWLVLHGLWINYREKQTEPAPQIAATGNDAQDVPASGPSSRKKNLRRGFVRLGLVLTTLWWIGVSVAVCREYLKRNLECQFSDYGQDCSMFFWSWISQDFDPARVVLNIKNVLLVATAPPLAGLLLGLSLAWVVRGFSAANEP